MVVSESSLREAETELVAAYTAAVGVAAQKYEPRVDSTPDPGAAMLAQVANDRRHREEVSKAQRTLAHVGSWSRWVIEILFRRDTAFGATSDLLAQAVNRGGAASLCALLPLTARVQRYVARQRPSIDVPQHEVLRMLETLARAVGGSGTEEERIARVSEHGVFAESIDQAEQLKRDALAEYAEVMVARQKVDNAKKPREKTEKRRRDDRSYRDVLAGLTTRLALDENFEACKARRAS